MSERVIPRGLSVDLLSPKTLHMATEADFWKRVSIGTESECWLWNGELTVGKTVYGRASIGGERHQAHRVAWATANGSIPAGVVICHRCDNPLCCNPAHLFAGTLRDNMQDMLAKGRGNKPFGERHGCSVLTEDRVKEIRQRCTDGEARKSVAASLGVSRSTIDLIMKRKIWRRV